MKNPLFTFDQQFWQQGISLLCGIDEAGRGPLAGPVVAAAVVFTNDTELPTIDDSKKLSPQKRFILFEQIKQKAFDFGIGLATVEEIQQKNILQATFLAMQRAVDQLQCAPDFVLVDGRDFPVLRQAQSHQKLRGKAVVKGDRQSQCIAAASVLAKVYRDRLMEQYAVQYPLYGFERHKGYATKEHRAKIVQFGPCPIHRRHFLRKLEAQQRNLFEA